MEAKYGREEMDKALCPLCGGDETSGLREGRKVGEKVGKPGPSDPARLGFMNPELGPTSGALTLASGYQHPSRCPATRRRVAGWF